jgi:hypothetical protein
MANPLLLMAFAYSTKIKSEREQAQARAAQIQKTAITNYAYGKNGIRPVDDKRTLQKGEKLYGFTVGASGTINKFPETEQPLIDLYEYNGRLVTKQQYNAMNTGYSSVDKADSTTTTTKPPLGMVVAQRSPANNELIYMNGYTPFDITTTKETVPVVLVKGKPVKAGPNQIATHTVTMENGKITSAPEKIEVDKKVRKFVKYLDDKGNETKDFSKIKFFVAVTQEDGVDIEVGERKPFTPKQGDKLKTQVFIDKNGNVTNDRAKAVKQRIDTFDSTGTLLEEGKEEDYQLVKPENVSKIKTRYKVTEINNPKNQKFVSETEALKLQSQETHTIDAYQNINEKGEYGKIEPYNIAEKKSAIDNAMRSKDIVATLSFATDEKDKNLKTVYKNYSFYRNQTGEQNLTGLNNFFLQNPEFLNIANTDPNMEAQVRNLVTNALGSFFRGEIKTGDKVHFTKSMPKQPSNAYTTAGSQFLELSKLKNFKEYTLIASGLADEKIKSELMKNAEAGETNLIVKKNVTDNTQNKVVGTVYAAVGVPEQYKSTIETASRYIGDVRDENDVGGLIERLIVYDTDENGQIKTRENIDGTKSNIPSQSQPALDFIETLAKTNLSGKTIKGRQATMLDGFLSMIHPFPNEHPVGVINTQIQEDIKEKFAALANYDFKKAMNLIASFTAKNSAATNILMEQFYGEEYSTEKVRADLRGKSTSAYNGIMTIDAMEQTYFTEDGQFIDVNTKQGEYAVTAVGVYQTGKKFIKGIFQNGKILDIAVTDGNELANSLINQNDIYESVNPNDSKEIEARNKNTEAFNNIKNVISGAGNINDFVDKLPKAVQQQLGGDRSTEVLRKLAIRQYHKYMLAYQLAAAIQGGTGGRTISDQDVQNILNSLNFGVFTPAAVEVATLRTARDMLTQLYDYNEALLNPSPSVQFAGYKAQQLLMGKKRGAMLTNIAARRRFVLNSMSNITGAGLRKDSTTSGISTYARDKQKKIEDIILGKGK